MSELDRSEEPQGRDPSAPEGGKSDGEQETWSQTDIDAFFCKSDTSWIADLVPKLDAPHIAGLDAFYPKIDTSRIADLVPKLDAPWIADLESFLPRFDSSCFELLADVVRQRVRSFPPNWLTVSTVDVFDDEKLGSVVLR